jgi:hypothetical protein
VDPIDEARNHPLSYAVRTLRAPDGRKLFILGEAHLKLARAKQIGQAVVKQFSLRGVETFPRKKVFGGTLLKWVIHAPRILLRILSLGLIKGSTIADAQPAFELENVSRVPLSLHLGASYLSAFFLVCLGALFVPELVQPALIIQLHLWMVIPAYLLRKQPWHWVLNPIIAILTVRNQTMAEGTIEMLRQNPHGDALVIMGRAHLPGYEQELIEKYGFSHSP